MTVPARLYKVGYTRQSGLTTTFDCNVVADSLVEALNLVQKYFDEDFKGVDIVPRIVNIKEGMYVHVWPDRSPFDESR